MLDKLRQRLAGHPAPALTHTPYRNPGLNLIYNLLFCDDLDLYRAGNARPSGPWTTLFAESPDVAALRALAEDSSQESRLRVLAYNRLRAAGEAVPAKLLLGVVVEVGLENGLDVLAAFTDRRARYINHTEKMSVFESPLPALEAPIAELLAAAQPVVDQIGPWNKPRLDPPTDGTVRLSFLVSGGLYFGQGPLTTLQRDALAGPIITASLELLNAIVDQTVPRDIVNRA